MNYFKEDKPDDIHSKLDSALSYLEKKDFLISSKLFTEVLALNSKCGFLTFEDELLAIEGLGISLLDNKESVDQGLLCLKEVYERLCLSDGTNAPITIKALNSYAEAAFSVGHFEEALSLFSKECKLLEKRTPTSNEYIMVRFSCSLVLKALERYGEAIAIHESNLQLINSLSFLEFKERVCSELLDCLFLSRKLSKLFKIVDSFLLDDISERAKFSFLLYKCKALYLIKDFERLLSYSKEIEGIAASSKGNYQEELELVGFFHTISDLYIAFEKELLSRA